MNKLESISSTIVCSAIPLSKGVRPQLPIAVQIALAYLDYSIKALEAFQNGNLRKFDALCGDQACQIRSVIISELFVKERGNGFSESIKTIEALRASHIALS